MAKNMYKLLRSKAARSEAGFIQLKSILER